MTIEEKKAFLLLNSVIFHYHGLDDDEKEMLDAMADDIGGEKELQWANEFIAKDYISAYERAREYFKETLSSFSQEVKINFLKDVWQANLKKGYITEMEAMAILTLSKDWDVENDLIKLIRS